MTITENTAAIVLLALGCLFFTLARLRDWLDLRRRKRELKYSYVTCGGPLCQRTVKIQQHRIGLLSPFCSIACFEKVNPIR